MKRRKISILALLLLVSISLPAQKSSVLERVYISTDKDCYVAGDYVGCSVFCFDVTDGERKLSDFSSVVYMELTNADGVALKEKIALTHGRGSGILNLPPELPTGNYCLVGYTKQNKNEKEFVPSGKMISIFNVFSSERVKEFVSVAEKMPAEAVAEQNVAQADASEIEIRIAGGENNSSVSIISHCDEIAELSISVFHNDSLSAIAEYGIRGFLRGLDTTTYGAVENKHIPDYEGEVIEVATNCANRTLMLSFPGKEGEVYTSKAGADGRALFYTNSTYGDKDAFLLLAEADSSFRCKMEVVSPFIGRYDYEYPVLTINEAMRERLVLRGMGMQAVKRFGGDTLADKLPQRPNPVLGKPDKTYLLDDYTRFATMPEVFIEYVSEVIVRTVKGKPEFYVANTDFFNHMVFSNTSSLILLDGVPIQNKQKILDYDPALVKEIRVYSHSMLLSSLFFSGAININTFKGNLPSFTLDNNISVTNFNGILYPQSLTWSKIKDFDSYPDLRQTIYWHPLVTLSANESYDFNCVFPKYQGTFEIVVEGVTVSGKPIYVKKPLSASR